MIEHFKQFFKSSFLGIGGLILMIILILGFVLLSQQVIALKIEAFDTVILQQFFSLQSPQLNQLFLIITFLGQPKFLLILNLIFCLFLFIQSQRTQSILFLITGSTGIWLNLFLKSIFNRSRPELWERVIDAKSMSYPSGHAMDSMIIYGLICYYLMTQFKARRVIILILTSLLILLIGMSRLYFGVHWPTDIIAGYAVGLIWVMTAILSLEIIEFFLQSKNHNSEF